mgnify:CR=1 FL=1
MYQLVYEQQLFNFDVMIDAIQWFLSILIQRHRKQQTFVAQEGREVKWKVIAKWQTHTQTHTHKYTLLQHIDHNRLQLNANERKWRWEIKANYSWNSKVCYYYCCVATATKEVVIIMDAVADKCRPKLMAIRARTHKSITKLIDLMASKCSGSW